MIKTLLISLINESITHFILLAITTRNLSKWPQPANAKNLTKPSSRCQQPSSRQIMNPLYRIFNSYMASHKLRTVSYILASLASKSTKRKWIR